MLFLFLFQVTTEEIEDLKSNQEETDTCIVLYVKYAAQQGIPSIVVRCNDTDVFFILLHHAAKLDITIYIDAGAGKAKQGAILKPMQRKLISVTEIAEQNGPNKSSALLGLYVYTCEDAIKCIQIKRKGPPIEEAFRQPTVLRHSQVIKN